MGDLPQIPCYDSTECKEIFNCGGITGDLKCDEPTPSSGKVNCPSGTEEGYCFGNNSDFCSGVLQFCPGPMESGESFKCENVSNPTRTIFQDLMGCDALNDPNCLEFTNAMDQFSGCQDECWDLGGKEEIDNKCAILFENDEVGCNSMQYFCKWDNSENKCVSSTSTLDPWDRFKKDFNILPAQESSFTNYTVEIKPSGQCQTIGPLCREVEGLGETWNLKCSRSSWDSTKMTSFSEKDHICCLNRPGEDKKCIATPRCQFVENTCDCGSKDVDGKSPKFMCADNLNNVKNGYCTWCKGQQKENFDFNFEEDSKKIIEWGTSDNCTNRCSNFNECEVDDSEVEWNKCVWEVSENTMGVDPELVVDDPSLLKKGFCFDPNSPEQENVRKTCENLLFEKYATRNQNNVRNPANRTITPFGIQKANWIHTCNQQSSSESVARNYVCTWCPSLQLVDQQQLAEQALIIMENMGIGFGISVVIVFIVFFTFFGFSGFNVKKPSV